MAHQPWEHNRRIQQPDDRSDAQFHAAGAARYVDWEVGWVGAWVVSGEEVDESVCFVC